MRLRTRAVARRHYRIADGHSDNQFVNIVLRIAPGRAPDVKREAGETLFRAACDFLEPVFSSSPLAISYEIQELDAEYRWKQNNLREYMTQRQEGK
jgi:5-carboxymethyl-2-hydroxymuconate isomerase